MKTYKIIGVMTGNSMDAVDLVLTEFCGDKMKDVCCFSLPFNHDMQQKTAMMRAQVSGKTKTEILALPDFKAFHDEYVLFVANALNQMCLFHNIDKKQIDAIGFHGKTLDHNPPSKAKRDGTKPYTLQIGSGKMLADLTAIKVVYDFRSSYVLAGFEGAPLIGPHNAHISLNEGDGIYYNGGNTSNFALVLNKKAVLSSDAGPFNEYIDAFIRQSTGNSFDLDGKYGLKGKLCPPILQNLFDICRDFYQTGLEKSGDPQYYKQSEVIKILKKSDCLFEDLVFTLEYFAAYIAVQALTLIDKKYKLPPQIVLFGGGWKNPVVKQSFEKIIQGQGFVFKEHQQAFAQLKKRFLTKPQIKYSAFGEMMEARLMADMAYFRLLEKPWAISCKQNIVSGQIAYPQSGPYDDMINLAAKE